MPEKITNFVYRLRKILLYVIYVEKIFHRLHLFYLLHEKMWNLLIDHEKIENILNQTWKNREFCRLDTKKLQILLIKRKFVNFVDRVWKDHTFHWCGMQKFEVLSIGHEKIANVIVGNKKKITNMVDRIHKKHKFSQSGTKKIVNFAYW